MSSNKIVRIIFIILLNIVFVILISACAQEILPGSKADEIGISGTEKSIAYLRDCMVNRQKTISLYIESS